MGKRNFDDTNDAMVKGDNMVKEATALKSLKELELSDATYTYLSKHFEEPGEVVRAGRILAFRMETSTKKIKKYEEELIKALKAAGFIRPASDFIMTFNAGSLFERILEIPSMARHREKFRAEGKIPASIEELTNAEYEEMPKMNSNQIYLLNSWVRFNLAEKYLGYEVITRYFGLEEGGVRKNFAEIAKEFYVTYSNIQTHYLRALRILAGRLRNGSTKPPKIFSSSENFKTKKISLEKELEETKALIEEEIRKLKETPIFARKEELEDKLRELEETPFYTDVEEDCSVRIADLGLPIRSYNCLIRAGFKTLDDILNFPKDKWAEIKGFGPSRKEELKEVMRNLGYRNIFS